MQKEYSWEEIVTMIKRFREKLHFGIINSLIFIIFFFKIYNIKWFPLVFLLEYLCLFMCLWRFFIDLFWFFIHIRTLTIFLNFNLKCLKFYLLQTVSITQKRGVFTFFNQFRLKQRLFRCIKIVINFIACISLHYLNLNFWVLIFISALN